MDDVSPSDAAAVSIERHLIAYVVSGDAAFSIEPAARTRGWMDATPDRYANRCLPLLMGNQSGWVVVTRHTIEATWDGGDAKEAIHLTADPPIEAMAAVSHFGQGILTWQLPYLFRTPPDFDLLVRGPANFPKDGAYALDGLVETGWAVATFTMNWKLTRPNHTVRFEAGEPIAMIVPQRRNDLESFTPRFAPIESNPQDAAGYHAWRTGRGAFLKKLSDSTTPIAPSQGWEKHYFQGKVPGEGPGDGLGVEGGDSHRSKLELRPFTRD